MAKPKTTDDSLQASIQAVSTADTFFPTNPGGITVDLPGVMEDDERSLNSARLGELREEAEMRAEHQAKARLTMLNLARALEESHLRQKELQKQLLKERESLAPLHNRIECLERELEEALLQEEKRKAEELLEKGFKSGNKLFLAMMLEKSREVYRSDHFDHKSECGDAESVADSRAAGSEAGADSREAGADSRVGSGGSRVGGGVSRPSSGKALDFGDAMLGVRRSRSSHNVNKAAGSGIGSAGDRVFFHWILKLWYREVMQNKEQRSAEQDQDLARKRLDEELRRKMQEEVEARVRDMQKQVESIGKQLDAANETIEQFKKRARALEKQLEKAYLDAAEREEQLQATIAQLRSQLEEALQKLMEREADIKRLEENIQEQHYRYNKAQADFETERRKLQEAIRKITTELHEATILAKYMRETMLKSKRDAASSVSPSKFAELIAQLESMRDELGLLRKDYTTLKDDNADLHHKLDKNRRRLELERQFLPLIRHARGPVGPKAGVNSTALGTPTPDQVSPEMPKKLHRSHSAVSHSGTKGYSLGGALGAPGGS